MNSLSRTLRKRQGRALLVLPSPLGARRVKKTPRCGVFSEGFFEPRQAVKRSVIANRAGGTTQWWMRLSAPSDKSEGGGRGGLGGARGVGPPKCTKCTQFVPKGHLTYSLFTLHSSLGRGNPSPTTDDQRSPLQSPRPINLF